jgi:hypothetical protein
MTGELHPPADTGLIAESFAESFDGKNIKYGLRLGGDHACEE